MNLEYNNEIVPIWMRCPYDADLCGADASLSDFVASDSEGWSGVLTCANGHVFRLTQASVPPEDTELT